MQRISALLTVFKMFEIRCSPLRTLRDLFRQADAGPPGSAHGKVAAELGHIVAGGVIRQEHAHNAEVGLKEGKLGLGRGLRGLLGPLRLSQFLFGPPQWRCTTRQGPQTTAPPDGGTGTPPRRGRSCWTGSG